jgi:cysteine desulfurase
VAGFRVALEACLTPRFDYDAVALERARLEQFFSQFAQVNGVEAPRLGHVLNVSVPGFRGDELVAALDLSGVCVSSGSACSAGTSEPSPVIRAMHDEARALSAVRFSLGPATTGEEVDQVLDILRRVLGRG